VTGESEKGEKYELMSCEKLGDCGRLEERESKNWAKTMTLTNHDEKSDSEVKKGKKFKKGSGELQKPPKSLALRGEKGKGAGRVCNEFPERP